MLAFGVFRNGRTRLVPVGSQERDQVIKILRAELFHQPIGHERFASCLPLVDFRTLDGKSLILRGPKHDGILISAHQDADDHATVLSPNLMLFVFGIHLPTRFGNG